MATVVSEGREALGGSIVAALGEERLGAIEFGQRRVAGLRSALGGLRRLDLLQPLGRSTGVCQRPVSLGRVPTAGMFLQEGLQPGCRLREVAMFGQ